MCHLRSDVRLNGISSHLKPYVQFLTDYLMSYVEFIRRTAMANTSLGQVVAGYFFYNMSQLRTTRGSGYRFRDANTHFRSNCEYHYKKILGAETGNGSAITLLRLHYSQAKETNGRRKSLKRRKSSIRMNQNRCVSSNASGEHNALQKLYIQGPSQHHANDSHAPKKLGQVQTDAKKILDERKEPKSRPPTSSSDDGTVQVLGGADRNPFVR